MLSEMSARKIAVSGLRAQRERMNIIANNLANAQTTRTPDGEAFHRQLTLLQGRPLQSGARQDQGGVWVSKVVKDMTPLEKVYDPSHPDADAEGYLSLPNVNVATEMVDLISAQRAYEANIAVLASGSRMRTRALEILQRS
jgi:flagellar basal-body rod protein FlgC